MKRIISLIIVMTVVLSMFSAALVSAGAADLICEDFTYTLNEKSEAVITGYTGDDTVVTIPSSVDGYKVTALGIKSFYYNSEITRVILPNTITSLGREVFTGCSNLTSIDLSQTAITKIDYKAFAGCRSLLMIAFPKTILTIGEEAFKDCKALEYSEKIGNRFDIPQTVERIDKGAFENCDGLLMVTIPEKVSEISALVFTACDNLKTVVFEGNITKIGNHAFSTCYALNNIILPNSVTEIGSFAFSYCNSLEYIKIPKETVEIKSYAFDSCENLSEVEFNEKVKIIGEMAFSGCKSIKNVVLPKSVESIDYCAFGSTFTNPMNLERITILNPDCTLNQSALTIDEDATIVCYENSLAHLYALKYNRKFEFIGTQPEEITVGDTDGDGEITILDATQVQLHLAQLVELDESQSFAADTDKNGEISILDVTNIQLFLADIITEF